jgi:hypothetical protein
MALTNFRKLLNGRSSGSLMPLSFGFFIISISLLFLSVNINAAYATKKELINLGESAIQRAAHEMDTTAYYLELNRFSLNKRVPINCPAARSKFIELISIPKVSGKAIEIEEIKCSLFEISAKISLSGLMPLEIPMLGSVNGDQITITASIGANSPYQLS